MRLRNTAGAVETQDTTAKTPRDWKRRAGAVALSAALLGAMPAATAGASIAQAVSSNSTVSAAAATGDWRYITDYFWRSDCHKAGNNGKLTGAWREYQCRNGSTWSNYDLFVR